MIKAILILIGCVFLTCAAMAQDLEKLAELKNVRPADLVKKGIKISGMAGANFVYYNATGIENRNIPFNAMFTGNLNVNLFGKINMPVSFTLSNQNVNWSYPFDRNYRFIQPFNRFVLKPTYKGFTLHVGVCSMNFSPFTLAGHRFDGAGLEYKPKGKPFYFGVMYGNLKRAIRIDSSFQTSNNIPSYKRTGMGFQVGYRMQEDKAEIIFFTAKDNLKSLPYNLDAYHIAPQQNAVVSLKGAKAISGKWLLDGEVALSGITQDVRAQNEGISSTFFNSYLGTLQVRSSTEYKKAIKSGLTYKGKSFNAGLEYSRIDPEYKTLGAYYFVNDLQTIAAKVALQLLQGKMSLGANLGRQNDNVEKQKLKTLNRWVGAASLTYMPTEKVSVMATYSSFTSFSNLRSTYDYLSQVTPYQVLDTLNFRQINQNIQAGISIDLPSKNEKIGQSLGMNLTLQRGADSQGSAETKNNLSDVSLDYSYSVKPLKLNISASVYYNKSSIAGLEGTQLGPSVIVAKVFGKEEGIAWKTNAGITYTSGKMNGTDQKMLNARVGLSAAITKQLNLNYNMIYLDRKAISRERFLPSFREFTGTLGLVYNFSVL